MKSLHSARWFFSCLALCAIGLSAAAADTPKPKPAPADIEFRETKTGVRYGLWSRSAKPAAPTLIILANSIEETLGSVHFREAGQVLGPEGWLCVSIDLPRHGREFHAPQRSGLAGWRERADHGEDFVTETDTRLSQVLDQLIADGLADPARIAVLGTSRGGFLALQFAAHDPRVKCVAAYAPVTDLAALTEFKGAEANPLVEKLALAQQLKALAGRAVWIAIGDRDVRVGTDLAIQFARRLTAASLAAQQPALVELHVLPEPRGHSLPPRTAEESAAWLRRQFP